MNEGGDEHIVSTRSFFAPRAGSWDERFPDGPAYAQAVADTAPARGQAVLDLGCGTGRAFAALRTAVGVSGSVVGLDVTPEMLDAAHAAALDADASLVLGDARRLPFRARAFDTVFAAGLLPHLPDAPSGLAELARIVRPGGRLALFHPIGRAALAARHGRPRRDDETLDPRVLPELLRRAGWTNPRIADDPHRYFAIADRASDGLIGSDL